MNDIKYKENVKPEELFEMACTGNIPAIHKYKEDGRDLNVRYSSFGEEHSLIMGAFRNREYRTVEWLLSAGCTLTDKEQKEINEKYYETYLIGEMQTIKK